MFKDFRTWLIIGLVVIIAYLILSKPNVPNPLVEIRYDSIAVYKAKAATAVKAQKEIEEKLSINARKDSVSKTAFEIENNRLKKKLAVQRVRVDTIILTNPVLTNFVNTQDSLIDLQAHRIDSLTLEKLVLQKSFNTLVIQKDTEIQSLLEINRNMDQIVDLKNKENRKLRRKDKLVKVAAVVGTIAGLFVGSKL